MLVSGRLLADITKALPAKPVDVVVDGARVDDLLRQQPVHACRPCRSRTTRRCRRCRRSPGSVDGDVFAAGRAQVAVAAGRDDTLPMLTGIRLEIDGDR